MNQREVDLKTKGSKCPYEKTISMVGDKYVLRIVKTLHLQRAPMRFNELHAALEPLSSKTLSVKLKQLIAHRIVRKDVVSTTPIIATYRLTDKGHDLNGLLDEMAHWSEKWHK